MVNFKEPFSVLIKHFFTAVDVALEWKIIHSEETFVLESSYYCIVYSGVILKPFGCEEAQRGPPRSENPSTSLASIWVANTQCQ